MTESRNKKSFKRLEIADQQLKFPKVHDRQVKYSLQSSDFSSNESNY